METNSALKNHEFLHKRRRPKAAVACESCRIRKSRCDQQHPCSGCVQISAQCLYRDLAATSTATQPRKKRASRGNVANIPLDSTFARSDSFTEVHKTRDSHDVKQAFRELQPKMDANSSAENTVANSTTESSDAVSNPKHHGSALREYQNATDDSSSASEEAGVDSFRELNRHTRGTEFYGPTGIFSFLQRLRKKAQDCGADISRNEQSSGGSFGASRIPSVVNLLHNSDYSNNTGSLHTLSSSKISEPPISTYDNTLSSSTQHHKAEISHHHSLLMILLEHQESSDVKEIPRIARSADIGSQNCDCDCERMIAFLTDFDIEMECVSLFFRNLHLIHPILNEADFSARCKTEFWSGNNSSHKMTRSGTFYALFNSVLALGAITAGNDASFLKTASSANPCNNRDISAMRETLLYPPLRLAKIFFDRSKTNLGDVFEASSLESTQALFLMSVFCQNALKPHSCYLFSGMAVRSAFAIGITESAVQSLEKERLWWAMYSHEIEMCASVGRQSALKEANKYPILLPRELIGQEKNSLLNQYTMNLPMATLAEIFRDISLEIYDSKTLIDENSRLAKSLKYDSKLDDWKSSLPPSLNIDHIFIVEPGWVMKQKVVLKLRYLNARLLLHRPFTILAVSQKHKDRLNVHVNICTEVSRETIQLIHETYLHHAYFRTWWYNTTYILYATMILLYVLLCNLKPGLESALIVDIERSIEVLEVMRPISVARKCVEITREILDVTKRLLDAKRRRSPKEQPADFQGQFDLFSSGFPTWHAPLHNEPDALDATVLAHGDLIDFSSLIDRNLLNDIANGSDAFQVMPNPYWAETFNSFEPNPG